MRKKIYVLDTSVCLTDYRSLFSYQQNDVFIPLAVLEEIDNNKKRLDSVGSNARSFIRTLDSLRENGNLFEGIKLGKNLGKIFVKKTKTEILPIDFNSKLNDNLIISIALDAKSEHTNRKVILVSCDINMRIKCDSLQIETEGYFTDQSIKDRSDLYSGIKEVIVKDSIIDEYYNNGKFISLDKLEIEESSFYPNQIIVLKSDQNDKKTSFARYIEEKKSISKINSYNKNDWGFFCKNKEQEFALDLLMDPNISLITLTGKSGTGKTLIALAAGLMQTMVKDSIYRRFFISRPIQPIGKEIGFIPGSESEKLSPWLRPALDNLRYLCGDDQITIDEYISRKIIEVEALTFIRGRSIQNTFILIDEAQNTSRHEIKTILTRVGFNSKIVLTGDIEQIDNVNLDETTNGLTYVIEKFKDQKIAGHITLSKGERSEIATIASKIL